MWRIVIGTEPIDGHVHVKDVYLHVECWCAFAVSCRRVHSAFGSLIMRLSRLQGKAAACLTRGGAEAACQYRQAYKVESSSAQVVPHG